MAERRGGEPDDPALVRAVAAGSEEALAALYDRHVGAVHATAYRLTRDRQLAEEVVQETFLALWNRAELFDPATASLATWLRSIARNRTIDRLRAIGRRPTLVPLSSTEAPGWGGDALDRMTEDQRLGGITPPPDPERAVEQAEQQAAVASALDAMPDPERAVILLAYREGLTQAEIAGRLGWPLGTVKTRTRRALRRLRAALGDPTLGVSPVASDEEEAGRDGSR